MKDEFLNAVTGGNVERVKEMLGSNPELAETTDKNGTTALLLAVYYRRPTVADALLAAGVGLNIFEAAALGQTERVRTLVEEDAGWVNAYATDGFYPLGLAVFFGHPDTARWLIEHGADVEMAARNPLKVRPLHAAASASQLESAAMLIEKGADVNATQQAGLTPLHAAAGNGQLDFARLLLTHGAALDAKCDAGKTAMDYATENKQTEMARFLESASSK